MCIRDSNNPAPANGGTECEVNPDGDSVEVACNEDKGECPGKSMKDWDIDTVLMGTFSFQHNVVNTLFSAVLDIEGTVGIPWQASFGTVDGTDFNGLETYISGLVTTLYI